MNGGNLFLMYIMLGAVPVHVFNFMQEDQNLTVKREKIKPPEFSEMGVMILFSSCAPSGTTCSAHIPLYSTVCCGMVPIWLRHEVKILSDYLDYRFCSSISVVKRL